MNDFVREDPARDALAAACRKQGITGPDDFWRRYRIAPAELTAAAALALVGLPRWVFDVWLPNAGMHGVCVYVPQAVAAYGRIVGMSRKAGETPQEYTERLRAAWKERTTR